MLPFHPMPLQKRSQPFDDPDWLFELKYDGFRALAVIEPAGAQLVSRNGNPRSRNCGHPFLSTQTISPSSTVSLVLGRKVASCSARLANDLKVQAKFLLAVCEPLHPPVLAVGSQEIKGEEARITTAEQQC
jgi:hypothetical protein